MLDFLYTLLTSTVILGSIKITYSIAVVLGLLVLFCSFIIYRTLFLSKAILAVYSYFNSNEGNTIKIGKSLDSTIRQSEILKLLNKCRLYDILEEYFKQIQELKSEQQGSPRGFGQSKSQQVQQSTTTSAGDILNKESVINDYLLAELLVQVPGFLTGFGIVGTFIGLVHGVKLFDASSAEKAIASLPKLLDGVQDGFIFSGVAIFSAIVISVVYRFCSLKSVLYLNKLVRYFDRVYLKDESLLALSKIAHNSEDSSLSLSKLRQDLRDEFEKIISDQTATLVTQSKNLSTSFEKAQSIEEIHLQVTKDLPQLLATAITPALDKISLAVDGSAGRDHKVLAGTLDQLLKGFIVDLKSTMGDQFEELRKQNNATLQLIGSTNQSLSDLLFKIETQNIQSANNFKQQVEDVFNMSTEQHSRLKDSVQELMDGISERVNEMMTKTSKVNDEHVYKLTESLTSQVALMSCQREQELLNQNKMVAEFKDKFTESLVQLEQSSKNSVNSSISVIADITQKIHRDVEQVLDKITDGVSTASDRLSSELVKNTQAHSDQLNSNLNTVVSTVNNSIGEFITTAESVIARLQSRINAQDRMLTSIIDRAEKTSTNLLASSEQLVESSTNFNGSLDQHQRVAENVTGVYANIKELSASLSKNVLVVESASNVLQNTGSIIKESNLRMVKMNEIVDATSKITQDITEQLKAIVSQYKFDMATSDNQRKQILHEFEHLINQLKQDREHALTALQGALQNILNNTTNQVQEHANELLRNSAIGLSDAMSQMKVWTDDLSDIIADMQKVQKK